MRNGKPTGVCTACERYPRYCQSTFVCRKCGLRKRTCTNQVGGFGDPRRICTVCHMREHGFSPKMVRYFMHGGRSSYTQITTGEVA